MPKTSILSSLELVCPVICENKDCENQDKVINMVFVPVDEEDSFFESFGHPAEEEDSCSLCEKLGVLSDPFAYFFYTDFSSKRTIALRMNLDFIESLQRLLKNAKDEGGTAEEKIYLASDPSCNFFDEFHVFDVGSPGEDNDFVDGTFDFQYPPYHERSKVATVGEQGVFLSVDISTKGDNERELGTIRTCWFSTEDLAELNSWIVERVGTGREEEESPD